MNRNRNKITVVLCLATLFATVPAAAQEGEGVWTAKDCMDYATKHNRGVKQRALELNSDKADRLRAIGSFLPGVSAGVGAQYNYGRSVDPETNTYKDISTFNNSYSLSASMPLLNGGGLVAELKRTRVGVLLGKAELEEERDNVALETYQAFIEVMYYKGTVEIASRKLTETDSLVRKTELMEELGLRGQGDVAQVKAQQAADAYHLTCQRNLLATSLLSLKRTMSYPLEDTLRLPSPSLSEREDGNLSLGTMRGGGVDDNLLYNDGDGGVTLPSLRAAELRVKSASLARWSTWSDLLPSVSMFAGVSTSYFKQLHVEGYPDFSAQFRNNRGTYFGFNLSVPLFNRLSGITSVRRARNNYRIAREQFEERRDELKRLKTQAMLDRDGLRTEIAQMVRKVDADFIAAEMMRKKYEEGLATSLDVQTCAATLLESRMNLLRSSLTYELKCLLVRYYCTGRLD